MSFSRLKGNESVVRSLRGMIDSGHIPHAILFHEDDGSAGFELCLAFLQYLYCENHIEGDACLQCSSCSRIARLMHPDVHLIVPTAAGQLTEAYMPTIRELIGEKINFSERDLASALKIEGRNSIIAVAEAKYLLDTLSLTAVEGGYRSVIIYLPEKMNTEAANKLLKMIEEPPSKTQFLLITHKPEKILPTISSRCQRIRIVPDENTAEIPEFDNPELFFEFMHSLLEKNLLNCLDISERIASLPSRESAKAFCLFASAYLREIFLAQQGVAEHSEQVLTWARSCPKTFPRKALAAIDRALRLIERNVSLKILFTDLANSLYILL